MRSFSKQTREAIMACTLAAASSAPAWGQVCQVCDASSSPQCVGERVGTDVGAPLCGAGLVCEIVAGLQCGCAAPLVECPPSAPVDVNECCNPATSGGGNYVDDDGDNLTVNSTAGGQISGSGATLFFPFFQDPSGTVDVFDVDGDGCFGNIDAGLFPTGCPPGSFQFVDNLSGQYVNGAGSPLNTFWLFQYRSVGSVNGFNEFVGNQLCGTLVTQRPAEGGMFNRFQYANSSGSLNGTGAYGTGSPLEPCEINFSFLDVPSSWGVQRPASSGTCFIKCMNDGDCPSGQSCVGGSCDPPAACTNDEDCILDGSQGKCRGGAKWDAQPNQPGYGLNPIPSSTGFLLQLQTLDRLCGTCSLGGNICDLDSNCNGAQRCVAGLCSIGQNVCASDLDCPLLSGQTCIPGGDGSVSLNADTANPDCNTIFDFVGATVPVGVIANRGTGVQNIKYSELQYLFATGRLPSGENLVAATRSAGSGTRNAIMNSLGIDTTWGRGDNVGGEYPTDAIADVGPGHQTTNAGGSGNIEAGVRSRRLAVGYTGLGGAGRAIADANAFQYEILNVCKDVDSHGNPLCDCDAPHNCPVRRQCSGTPTIDCLVDTDCPIGETCSGKLIDADSSNTGYVRPNTNTILDNCDPCCGYTISGNGSFVTRGDPFAIGGPSVMDDRATRDYIRNLAASVQSFSGPQPNVCVYADVCSIKQCVPGATGQSCNNDGDCDVGETCQFVNCNTAADCTANGAGGTCDVPRPCTMSAQCTALFCDNDPTMGCNSALDCLGGANCIAAPALCLNQENTPGQYLATNFTLPDGVDCVQSFDDGMVFSSNPSLNQTLQNYQRNPAPLAPAFPTPAFGSINANSGGRTPNRKVGFTYSDGQAGAAANNYVYWNGGGYVADLTANEQLAKRNRFQGDFNGDCARDLADAEELVNAQYGPRAWQQTAAALNAGTGCYGAAGAGQQTTGGSQDRAIPEVTGDFDGDGNLTREDLRYFADGLALQLLGTCLLGPRDGMVCKVNPDCLGGTCVNLKPVVSRKKGAIAVDEQIMMLSRPFPWADNSDARYCSVALTQCDDDDDCPGVETCSRLGRGRCTGANTLCQSDADCPGTGPCRQLDNGDTRRYGIVPAAGLGLEPTFLAPADINTFLATGKTYEKGDFRGDVAGGRVQVCQDFGANDRCSITGFPCVMDADCRPMQPNAGGDPIGWDGRVDEMDIDYCCAQSRVGTWTNINNAVFIDYSCDMNGDGDVNTLDLEELVVVILKTQIGDVDLDNDVDFDDQTIILNSIANPPVNPGWKDGDMNWDGVVDSGDLCAVQYYGDISGCPCGDQNLDVDDLLSVIAAFESFPNNPACPNGDVAPCQPDPCLTDDDCVISLTGPICISGACRCFNDADCALFGAACNESRQGGRCEVVDVDDITTEIFLFENFPLPNPFGCP